MVRLENLDAVEQDEHFVLGAAADAEARRRVVGGDAGQQRQPAEGVVADVRQRQQILAFEGELGELLAENPRSRGLDDDLAFDHGQVGLVGRRGVGHGALVARVRWCGNDPVEAVADFFRSQGVGPEQLVEQRLGLTRAGFVDDAGRRSHQPVGEHHSDAAIGEGFERFGERQPPECRFGDRRQGGDDTQRNEHGQSFHGPETTGSLGAKKVDRRSKDFTGCSL